jgi:hypothetical protein
MAGAFYDLKVATGFSSTLERVASHTILDMYWKWGCMNHESVSCVPHQSSASTLHSVSTARKNQGPTKSQQTFEELSNILRLWYWGGLSSRRNWLLSKNEYRLLQQNNDNSLETWLKHSHTENVKAIHFSSLLIWQSVELQNCQDQTWR